MSAEAKARTIRLMGFDVDGVLTDGRLYFGPEGETFKVFHSRDGHGLKLLMQAGIAVAVISGRHSAALAARCAELGICEVHMGIDDKLGCLTELLSRRGLRLEQAGYMGDDIVDLEILAHCGFSAAPADAHLEVVRRVDLVTQRPGGLGAVREVCDFLLSAQGHWALYLAQALGSPNQ